MQAAAFLTGINRCAEWQNLCGCWHTVLLKQTTVVHEHFSFRRPLVYPSCYLLADCARDTCLLPADLAFAFAIQDRRTDHRPAF